MTRLHGKFLALVLLFSLLVVGQTFNALKVRLQHRSSSRLHMKASDINTWAAAQGAKKDEIKVLFSDKNGGIEGRATTTIKPNEVMFSLPMGLCLDASKANAKFGAIAKKMRTGDLGALALLLLSEKAQGESSKYATYIKNLPQKAPGILSWSQDQLEELKKSTTRNVMAQIGAVAADWENVVRKLTPKDLPSSVLSVDNFRWAVGIVKAKAVYIDGDLMLVPGMDFIQFDPLSESEPYSASAGMFGGKVVKVVAERAYEEGEEVVMSYGLKSSAECLEDHGIVPDITLDDSCAEIAVSIDGTEKYPDDKLNILESAGYGPSRRFDLEADPQAELDPALLQFLRLKFIEGKDSFILESCFTNTAYATMNLPFSKPNELKVIQYLTERCTAMLAQMDSVSNDDKDEQISSSGEGPEAMMARLRLQERAALKGTLQRLKSELISLQGPDTREYYQERRLRELDLLRPLDDSEIIMPGERGRPVNDY